MIKRTLLFYPITLILVIAFISGCQDSPGGVTSPASDIHITRIDLPLGQIKSEEGGPDTITLRQGTVYFNITNGVSAFLGSYVINYYLNSGAPFANGRFDHSGAITLFVQARDLTWNTGQPAEQENGGGGGDGGGGGAAIRAQTAVPSANYISLEFWNSAIYDHMTQQTNVAAKHISPVIARITFRGRDINGNEFRTRGQGTLTTTLERLEDE